MTVAEPYLMILREIVKFSRRRWLVGRLLDCMAPGENTTNPSYYNNPQMIPIYRNASYFHHIYSYFSFLIYSDAV